VALVESSGGLSVMERVRYPSSPKGVEDLQSCNILGSGRWGQHFLLVGLPDGRLKDLAPYLFALIPKRLSKVRLVKDALDSEWLDDIPPNLDALVIQELFAVSDHVE
jgi:hypothetical protein